MSFTYPVEETQQLRITELEAENARLRKVADAAVAVEIAGDARIHVGYLRRERDIEAIAILYGAQLAGFTALNEAVREYRAAKEMAQTRQEPKDYIDDETGINLSLPPVALE